MKKYIDCLNCEYNVIYRYIDIGSIEELSKTIFVKENMVCNYPGAYKTFLQDELEVINHGRYIRGCPLCKELE